MASWRVIVAAAVLLGACGAEASSPLPVAPIEGTDRTVNVLITEFDFDLSSTEFVRGETVGFRISNKGVVSHEFRLTTKDSLADFLSNLPANPGDADVAKQAFDDGSVLVKVKPGETVELVVGIEETNAFDTVVCLVPGHLEAGMQVDLDIDH